MHYYPLVVSACGAFLQRYFFVTLCGSAHFAASVPDKLTRLPAATKRGIVQGRSPLYHDQPHHLNPQLGCIC